MAAIIGRSFDRDDLCLLCGRSGNVPRQTDLDFSALRSQAGGNLGMFFRSSDPSVTHVAVLGNALPRRCGIATYTTHSVEALRTAYPSLRVDHYAMDDGHGASYNEDVFDTISAGDRRAYERAASRIAASRAQLLWVHHEFGIFGGVAGDYLISLLRRIDIPVVVTFHTVLAHPNDDQRRVMEFLVPTCAKLIVMARRAADLLVRVYGADPTRIEVIPHGAPDRGFGGSHEFKLKLGLEDGPTILTFGLLSPGKGIETAILSLPAVISEHPDLRYLVIGATHPALVRDQGEAYRDSLRDLARREGVESHVTFVDRFLDNDELLDYLQAADIYLTPYLSAEQVTSGTLSYALAMGKPVVSTPYVHAQEALANGIGTIVPFNDPGAISDALVQLLADKGELLRRSRRVWAAFRSTIWRENAKAMMATFLAAVRVKRLSQINLELVASQNARHAAIS